MSLTGNALLVIESHASCMYSAHNFNMLARQANDTDRETDCELSSIANCLLGVEAFNNVV